MPFADPSESSGFDPETGKYTSRVLTVSDSDDYGNGPTIRWVFNLADSTGAVVIDPATGKIAEWSQLSSTSLGPKAKAREWSEAFLGHSVADMKGAAIMAALPGCTATIVVGPVKNKDTGVPRQRIVAIEPLVRSAAPAAPPAPAPEPVAAAPAAPLPPMGGVDPFAVPASA